MIKLVTAEQIRKHESDWIKKNAPGESLRLMEKAGAGLADIAKEHKGPYLIICGKGNNGGDGLVCARHLFLLNKKVNLFLTSDENSLSADAKINLEKLTKKINYLVVQDKNDTNFVNAVNSSNTILDCILGTGVSKQLSPLLEWIVKTINDTKKYTIACDIPTGLNPDTGEILTSAIKSDITVSFGYCKLGTFVYPGKEFCGETKIIDIGLPDISTDYFFLDDDFIKENLPERKETSNKGSFGKTLLICGSSQYPGAALLASKAAAKIGSGLTLLSSPKEVFAEITSGIPEVTHVEFELNKILEESKKSTVVVIGPGLTTESKIKILVEQLIENISVPIVLDADGINILSGNKKFLKKAKKEIVITPHPKEFSRLLGINTDEVLKNKINLVKSNAIELGCIIVLKGPATIIGTKEGKIFISPFANPALAKGGTGDVLAGFIGGLIAQGLKPDLAACVGVYLHGKAGELIEKEKTSFSLLPQDLIDYLPKIFKMYI